MRRIRPDRIDRRILRNLLTNWRMSNVELARRFGISASPSLRRVRTLEEAGIIRGYHADLAPEALGYGVTVFAQVGLSSQVAPNVSHVKLALMLSLSKNKPGIPITEQPGPAPEKAAGTLTEPRLTAPT